MSPRIAARTDTTSPTVVMTERMWIGLRPPVMLSAQATSEDEPASVPAPQPGFHARFFARLPASHREGLIALESEDHYVRVHSRGGSTLVLLRLTDAVAELDGIDGLRTHRRWWVARDAVAQVLRRDRATSLRLVNGIAAPVARNAVADLRAADWLGERRVRKLDC